MKEGSKDYIINENIYITIDNMSNNIINYSSITAKLLSEITNLFDTIEDDVCKDIILKVSKINDFMTELTNISKTELQELKNKSIIAIEKANKRKIKIKKLKSENTTLIENINYIENEKESLVKKIDSMSLELFEVYEENKKIEKKMNLELTNSRNQKIINEQYINKIQNLQKDMDDLEQKNKKYEDGYMEYKKKSSILEQSNNKLKYELNDKKEQFLQKLNMENQLHTRIKSLTNENEDLYKQLKSSQNQVEKLEEKCKTLEEKIIDETAIKEEEKEKINIKEDNNNLIEENSNDNMSDFNYLKYNTYNSLKDLLGDVSDNESVINYALDKKDKDDKDNKKKEKKVKRKNTFDISFELHTKYSVYDSFFP